MILETYLRDDDDDDDDAIVYKSANYSKIIRYFFVLTTLR